jgi:hypothetical protein
MVAGADISTKPRVGHLNLAKACNSQVVTPFAMTISCHCRIPECSLVISSRASDILTFLQRLANYVSLALTDISEPRAEIFATAARRLDTSSLKNTFLR